MDTPRFTEAPSPDPAAIAALAPSGVLRAGINLSNFLLVNGRGSSGEPTGVSPSIAAALAAALGAPLDLVTFANPGELADAVASWDIGNVGADPARAEHIAFSAPYCEIASTYLVRADSAIESIHDVDAPGIRVVSKDRAAYTLWLERHLRKADLVLTASTDESFERFASEDALVLAGLRPRLLTDAARVSGSRVLDGRFTAVQQAIGTPRNRPAAGVDYLQRFVAGAVESGFVTALIAYHGVEGLSVPSN